MYDYYLLLPLHLLWGAFEAIISLPFTIKLLIFFILLRQIVRSILFPHLPKYLLHSALQRKLYGIRPASIHLSASSVTFASPASPHALENDLLFLIFSFLFAAIEDPVEKQKETIKCERVCRSWFRVARALRQVVVKVNGERSPGLRRLCSKTERLYLHENPYYKWRIWRETLAGFGCYIVIQSCPNIQQLGLSIPMETIVDIFQNGLTIQLMEFVIGPVNCCNITELTLKDTTPLEVTQSILMDDFFL